MKYFLIKYLLWFLSFLTVVSIYLLQTSLGHHTLAQLFSVYLSKKTSNEIEVSALNISNYPILEMNLSINRSSSVHLKGTANSNHMSMDYHLVGDGFRYNKIALDTKVDISGHFSGLPSNLSVRGEGKVLEGETKFRLLRTSNSFKDVNLSLRSINSTKFLKFLHYKPLIKGKADIDARFKYFSSYKKCGKSTLLMRRATIPSVTGSIPFKIKKEVDFRGEEYFFKMGMKSDIGSFAILNGYVNKQSGELRGVYAIDIDELLFLEPLLKHQYRGKFETNGEFKYRNKDWSFQGKSYKFDGLIDYQYREKHLKLNLKRVSLLKLSNFLSYPSLLRANLYGWVEYDVKDGLLLINTRLRGAKFKKTKLTDMILKRIKIDILEDVYDNSSFVGRYQNALLKATLKVDNGVRHIYLTKMEIKPKEKKIKSKFELKIGGEELSGDIYGDLENPNISLDMKRLLKNQINRGLRSLFGIKEEKDVKQKLKDIQDDVSESLDEVTVDSVKEKAKKFLNGIF